MKSTRVLIADPDKGLAKAYDDALTLRGFQVATACDGLECLKQLRSFHPQLLVLDPALPWGCGEGVLAMMDEDMDVPRVPVFLLSADDRPDLPGMVAHTVVTARHVKPLAPHQLAEAVRLVLGSPI